LRRSNDRLERLLILLRDSKRVYRSGEELAKALGVSRVAVWKHVKTLRDTGYVIEAKPKLGYRLLKEADILKPTLVKEGLRTNFIGCEVRCYDAVPSTQSVVKEAAERGFREGFVAIAEEQTAGRGRRGRSWVSPRGGLWLSILLKPGLPPPKLPLLMLAAGLAVSKAVETTCGLKAELKWPNDVLINGRKVAGILAEASVEADLVHYVVLGIGVNVNNDLPVKLKEEATTLKEQLGSSVARVKLVQELLKALEDEYLTLKRGGYQEVLDGWRARSSILKSEVMVSLMGEAYEGVAEDVDGDGALILRLKDGSLKRFLAGDVTLRIKAKG